MTKRIRELISGPVTLDYFMQRAAEGWTIGAIEWTRELEEPAAAGVPELANAFADESVPYGLRIAEDCERLEENPLETAVLMLILEKIIQEKRVTEIAADLNLAGFRTRENMRWTPGQVFDLMPRLIEAGPRLLKSKEWIERRPQVVQEAQSRM